jgi:hypothetical protein
MWFVKPNPVGRLKFTLGSIKHRTHLLSEEDEQEDVVSA